MPRSRPSKRTAILASAAVVVLGVIGTTSVFLVGSAQRRDDRAAYLRYERAILVPIKDGGRLVEQEMKPSIADLQSGSLPASEAVDRANAWRTDLRQDKTKMVSLAPPKFLRGIEVLWGSAMDAYLEIPDLFARAAHATGPARSALIGQAAAAGTRADRLFDRAARAMQFHRRRLGLGPTHDLPDPSSTAGS